MARDLLLGSTNRRWERNSCRSLPADTTGYAPTRWWTAAQAEEKVQEFMKSGGIFGTSLPREVAEKKTIAYLRKNLIGITS